MQIHEYLETRFREYFRDATFIAINPSDEDDESTEVRVTLPIEEGQSINDATILVFICEPGSDDDCFIFVDYRGQDRDDAIDPSQVITIPFPLGGFC